MLASGHDMIIAPIDSQQQWLPGQELHKTLPITIPLEVGEGSLGPTLLSLSRERWLMGSWGRAVIFLSDVATSELSRSSK